jgi:hypothetical protein
MSIGPGGAARRHGSFFESLGTRGRCPRSLRFRDPKSAPSRAGQHVGFRLIALGAEERVPFHLHDDRMPGDRRQDHRGGALWTRGSRGRLADRRSSGLSLRLHGTLPGAAGCLFWVNNRCTRAGSRPQIGALSASPSVLESGSPERSDLAPRLRLAHDTELVSWSALFDFGEGTCSARAPIVSMSHFCHASENPYPPQLHRASSCGRPARAPESSTRSRRPQALTHSFRRNTFL